MKAIVSTTINPPTEAIHRFDAMADWTLIVAGDKKTPPDYKLERRNLPSRPKSRRNTIESFRMPLVGTPSSGATWRSFAAHDAGAEIVALVDDDNIPEPGWGQDLMVGRQVEVTFYETEPRSLRPGWRDQLSPDWHRGYPLQLLPKHNWSRKSRRTMVPDVQADFWNGDPDIDAICRMGARAGVPLRGRLFSYGRQPHRPVQFTEHLRTWVAATRLFSLSPCRPHGRQSGAATWHKRTSARVLYGKASVRQETTSITSSATCSRNISATNRTWRWSRRLRKIPESILQFLPGRAAEAFRLYQRHFR